METGTTIAMLAVCFIAALTLLLVGTRISDLDKKLTGIKKTLDTLNWIFSEETEKLAEKIEWLQKHIGPTTPTTEAEENNTKPEDGTSRAERYLRTPIEKLYETMNEQRETKAYTALCVAHLSGVETVADLLYLGKEKLKLIQGTGPKTIDAIEQEMLKHGVSFETDPKEFGVEPSSTYTGIRDNLPD